MRPSVVRRPAAASFLAALAALAGLTACGGRPAAAPAPVETAPNGAVFNAADAAFARDLLRQRAEEFALIDLTVGRRLDPELTAFLDRAREARAAEVDTTTTWLTDWGKDVPSTVRDHAAGHAGVHAFPEVEKASDADFQERWIATFLDELRDSGRIAAAEATHGANADARDLAASVRDTNEEESHALEELLA
ncbi:DUF305 domain-containing protein [Nocardioides jiangxiensis]|uniref:DUF305 domain-containing protein n=1 Tax=Nocardioides jiangxiensis TaxID=3064524 RepID=A0ABT9AYD8_9ACTN|nr:DUF305 domain-containing protein [Nocardioides sp. WY-20]MDO7866984.1 DUF305 domain-containing protein [Nocardioides sp. WY-20]